MPVFAGATQVAAGVVPAGQEQRSTASSRKLSCLESSVDCWPVRKILIFKNLMAS
jgi:hypothetical protein